MSKTNGKYYLKPRIIELVQNPEKVTVRIPHEDIQQPFQQSVRLGLFSDIASVEFKPDFKITDKQLLQL